MVEWFGWCSVAEYKVETFFLRIGVNNQVWELDNFPAPPGIELHILGMLICVRFLEFTGPFTYPISYLSFKYFSKQLMSSWGFWHICICNGDYVLFPVTCPNFCYII